MDTRDNPALPTTFSFLKIVLLFGAGAMPFSLDCAGLDYVRMFTREAFWSLSFLQVQILI